MSRPRRRPRVVHLTTVDMSLELLLGPQLSAFVAAGYDVVGASAPGPYVERIAARGVRHVALGESTRAMAPLRDLRAYREVKRVFRRLRPDIVHTHNPKPGVYGRLAARAAGVPVVVNTVHGLYAQPDDRLAKRALVYGLERLAARRSDAELVQNPEDVPVLERIGVDSAKIRLLGNGIDLGRFDPSCVDREAVAGLRAELDPSGEAVLVGVVGRLVRGKGYRELFAAIHALRRSGPAVRLAVVGPRDPDKSDALTEDEIRAAEADGVVFLGHRDDVETFYAAVDLFVLASHREGFSRSGMEAAAMGLPVVATDIRGCRQVVDDGATGLLVPRGDPAALAGAIRHLAEDPALRGRMDAAGRKKALAEFDQRRQIELTLEVYDRLLAARGRPRTEAGAPN